MSIFQKHDGNPLQEHDRGRLTTPRTRDVIIYTSIRTFPTGKWAYHSCARTITSICLSRGSCPTKMSAILDPLADPCRTCSNGHSIAAGLTPTVARKVVLVCVQGTTGSLPTGNAASSTWKGGLYFLHALAAAADVLLREDRLTSPSGSPHIWS